MANRPYKTTNIGRSEHLCDPARSGAEYRYILTIQECSFDGAKKQTRANLTNGAGGKYIHTVAIDDVWENAHFHENQSETYVLESGEAVLVVMENNAAVPRRLTAGEAVNLPCNVHHKLWMQKGARMHTVKTAAGSATPAPFRESAELEGLCDEIGLDHLLERATSHFDLPAATGSPNLLT